MEKTASISRYPFFQSQRNGGDGTDHDEINADIEGHDGGEWHFHTEQARIDPQPGHEGHAGCNRDETRQHRQQQPRAGNGQRMVHDGAPDCGHTISDAVDRQRRDRDQPADETAARLVMAAQQYKDGKQHHEAGDYGATVRRISVFKPALPSSSLFCWSLDGSSRADADEREWRACYHHHRNLAQRIRAAEIDDDDVHHIRPVGDDLE